MSDALDRLRRRDPLGDARAQLSRVYAYVAYRIGDGPDAEDVTGETFARAVRYRESYDPAKGAPVDWLIGIARRYIDDFGSRPRADGDPPDSAVLRDLEQETVTRVTVREAVSRLGERDRELLALRYGADLTARQIGLQLGLGTNAVEVALHRALERLRPLLADEPAAADVRVSARRRYLGVEEESSKGRRRR